MEDKEKLPREKSFVQYVFIDGFKWVNLRWLVLFMFIIIFSSLVNGEIVFTKSNGGDIKVPCYNSTSYCGSDVVCNITIWYPNGTVNVNNRAMTYNASYFNYTLTPNQTQIKGDYQAYILCSQSGIIDFYDFTFYVHPTGARQNTNIIIPAILILIPILLSFAFLFIASILHEDHIILKNFLYLFAILPFFVSFNFGTIALINFYDLTEMENLIGTTVWWIGVTFFVIVTYFIIYFIVIATHVAAGKRDKKLNY